MTTGTRRQSLPTLLACVALIGAALAVSPGRAEATYPGLNGKIAFESQRDGNSEIYVMNPDGSGQTNITNDSAADTDPAWSPDGTRIAFVKASEGHRNIWVMNADGSGQVNLTPGSVTTGLANDGVEPTWSPDGSLIAYPSGGDIWVMNSVNGGGKTNLTKTSAQAGLEGDPTWSPDGTRIAYVLDADIWVMDANGANRRALTATTGTGEDEKGPDWSPDGSQILYGKAGATWVMSANGDHQRRLVSVAVLPAWSPDGTKITFGSTSYGAPDGPEVFVANADGTGITQLTTVFPAIDTDPDWQPAPVGGRYTPLTPARILDTRSGGPIGSGATVSVQVAGLGGVPAAGVSAVALNVTVTQPTATGFLTLYPSGSPRPLAANLNFTPGKTVPNLVVAKLGADGKVSMYNSAGTTHVIYDVAGWYSTTGGGNAGRYSALAPARLLDTRDGTGGGVRLSPGGSAEVQVTDRAGVPAAGAAAAVLNVAATAPSTTSFLTVYPTGEGRPTAANLNFNAGETVSNRAMVKLGSGGKVTVYNNAGSVDVIVDVGGWFSDASVGGTTGVYTPLQPVRILDTRDGTGGFPGPLGSASTVEVQITGRGGVPSGTVGAVILNATVTQPAGPGFLTMFPTGTTRPLAADLNYAAGETRPNLVVVKVGAGGRVSLYTSAGTHVIFDVAGWIS